MKQQTIHEKAIRLIEGGQVSVDGHCVEMKQATEDGESCMQCAMDCICRRDSETVNVCIECEMITGKDCYLVLVTNDNLIKQ